MKCPWGCGWQGPADEYLKHYDECPSRVCPKCGSSNISFYGKDALECLTCGNKWPRKKVPETRETPSEVSVEDEKLAPKIFKTEEEFRGCPRTTSFAKSG